MGNTYSNVPVNKGKGFSLKSLSAKNAKEAGMLQEKELESFFEAVRCAKRDLESVQMLLDSTADPDVIEYAIYQERAAKLKLSYLVKEAKEKKIKAGDYIEV